MSWLNKGWRKEPARHALAAKGVGTSTKGLTAAGASPALSTEAMKSCVAIDDQTKADAIDSMIDSALREAGSEEDAMKLLQDGEWLATEAKRIAEEECGGHFLRKAKFSSELIRIFRENLVEQKSYPSYIEQSKALENKGE